MIKILNQILINYKHKLKMNKLNFYLRIVVQKIFYFKIKITIKMNYNKKNKIILIIYQKLIKNKFLKNL